MVHLKAVIALSRNGTHIYANNATNVAFRKSQKATARNVNLKLSCVFIAKLRNTLLSGFCVSQKGGKELLMDVT